MDENSTMDEELDAPHRGMSWKDVTNPIITEVLTESSFKNVEKDLLSLRNSWADFVETNTVFRGIVVAAIVLNALQLGLSIEVRGEGWDEVWYIMSHIFTAVFAVEMFFKLTCQGVKRYFGCGRWTSNGTADGDGMWNSLDFCLAWIGIIDNWIVPIASGEMNRKTNMPVFRLLRVVRMAKLVRANKHLTVLAEGMLASMKSLLWVALLLFVVIYSFAVAFVMLSDGFDNTRGSHWNAKYFGNTVRSMLSLFGVCIGAEWSSIVWPLMDTGNWVNILFLMLFVFIAQFGFLNIIVGVIVDRTNAANLEMKEREEQHQREEQMKVIRAIGNKMHEYDGSRSGGLNFGEFTDLLLDHKNEELRRIVKKDLPTGFRARDLHTILEADADGNLTQKEFEEGIERLIAATPYQERVLIMYRSATIQQQVIENGNRIDKLQAAVESAVRTEVGLAVAEIKEEIRRFISGAPADERVEQEVPERPTATRIEERTAALPQEPVSHVCASSISQDKNEGTASMNEHRRGPPTGGVTKGHGETLRIARASFDGFLETLRRQAQEIAALEAEIQTSLQGAGGAVAADRFQHESDGVSGAAEAFKGHMDTARSHMHEIEVHQREAKENLQRLLGRTRIRAFGDVITA